MSGEAIYGTATVLMLCYCAFLMGTGAFYGDEGGKALGGLLLLAFFWPFLLALSVVMAPFYLVFLLGRWYVTKFPPTEEEK